MSDEATSKTPELQAAARHRRLKPKNLLEFPVQSLAHEVMRKKRRSARVDANPITWWVVIPSAWARQAGYLSRSAKLLWQPMERALTVPPPFSGADIALVSRHVYAFRLVAAAALESIVKAAAI